jgi:hypothetical protein
LQQEERLAVVVLMLVLLAEQLFLEFYALAEVVAVELVLVWVNSAVTAI